MPPAYAATPKTALLEAADSQESTDMTAIVTTEQDARRKRTVVWVVSLVTVGMIFDGYDLVAYGAVVPTLLSDPSQIGEVTPAVAGTLGSYALLGMLFGALIAGAVGDIVGRRRVMLTAYAWFSVGMAITAITSSTTTFGDSGSSPASASGR